MRAGSGKELVSCLLERSYHSESCRDSYDNISQHAGHSKINEAPPKLEMINVTQAPTSLNESKNNPN